MQLLKQIGFIALVGIGSSIASEESLSVQNLANKVAGKPMEQINRDVLPKGNEEAVLWVLRKERAYDALFRLNDQPAIDEFISKYRAKKGLDRFLPKYLKDCKAPYILDELAPFLYEGPDYEHRRSTTGGEYYDDHGCAQTTATAMGEIIAKAPEFSEAVRKSVNDRVGESPATMRAWWEKNQQALREERYGEVTPIIRAVAAKVPDQTRKEAPVPRNSAPAEIQRTMAPPAIPSPGVREHKPAAVEAAGGQRGHSSTVIALGVLAVFIFAVGISIAFRRKW